jgi:hypothetical protein
MLCNVRVPLSVRAPFLTSRTSAVLLPPMKFIVVVVLAARVTGPWTVTRLGLDVLSTMISFVGLVLPKFSPAPSRTSAPDAVNCTVPTSIS